MSSIYSTSNIPQGIPIYANATLFPPVAQDGEQAVAADTNTLYIYDTSVPGWQPVANPGAAIAIDALTGEVTATGPGVVAATITAGAVTNSKLAAMADNTVKGNKSGAPASPSDLALSDVAETVSNVLTISNGTKSVVSAANLTIQVKQSSSVQDGYLSSGDWTAFNNAASTVSNATALATANTLALRDANADCAFNVLKIGAGTAAAPSLAYSADLDTGLFFAGNNIVNLSTNGVERVRVDASGNVGIGSQSPNARLQVNNSGTQLGLSVYSTSSNNTAELYNQGTTSYTLALNSAANSAMTGASIGGYFARGTLSSRAQTLANDNLLSISASGHTGSGVAGISGAIVIGADENTGAAAYGGQIVLATTPNSTPGGFPIPRLYVKNDGKINISGLTASQLVATDASKNLQSLSTATYPSLTELSYLKGVTSSVQNQLNDKASIRLDNLGVTAINASLLFSPDNSYDIGADGASRPSAIHAANHITSPIFRARDNDGLPQRQLTVRAGNSTSGNGDGGSLTLAAGTPNGTGTPGSLYLQSNGATRIELTPTGAINIPSLTASSFAGSDASKNLVSLSASTATSYLNDFVGDSGAGGTKGLVPAPAAGDAAAGKYLKADGSWATVSGLPSQTGNQYKVLATDGSTASWQYAGLGDGSLGTGNVVLGTGKGAITSGTANTIIGISAATTLSVGSRNIAIGNTARLASDAIDSIVIGNTTGSTIPGGANYNITIGKEAGGYAAGGIAGNIVVVGHEACRNSNPDKATCIGNFAGRNGVGSGDTFIGYSAGYQNSGGRNTVVGHQAGERVGQYATIMGFQAACVNSQNYVTAIGYSSAFNASGTGNVAVAMESLYNAVGNNNIGIGYQAGYDITGNQSICLGVWAGSRATAGKELYIANTSARLASNALEKTNSLVYGVFNDTVGSQRLTINGQVNFTQGEKHASVHAQTGTANVITATINNYYIGVNSTLAAKTVNLPAAATAGQGFVLIVKDEGGLAATNNIILQANGAETIDGSNTQTINANYGSLSLMCSGSAWFLAP